MRVLIAGGRSRIDFLIESLMEGGNEVVVVSDDLAWCEHVSARYRVPVVHGDATKRYVLDDADVEGFELVVALSECDPENLVICQMAQRYFEIGRQVCIVSDPRNVAIFKKLGVTSAISATYTVTRLIEEASLKADGNDASRTA